MRTWKTFYHPQYKEKVRSLIIDKLGNNIFKKKENSVKMLDELLAKLSVHLHFIWYIYIFLSHIFSIPNVNIDSVSIAKITRWKLAPKEYRDIGDLNKTEFDLKKIGEYWSTRLLT